MPGTGSIRLEGGAGVRRQVAWAQATKYGREISGGILDELDKVWEDGAGLDEEPGVRTDDGAGLAEVLEDEPVKMIRAYGTRGADGRRRVKE